ncbi:T9SS type B sorting domain-containing protein [uncultured Flavobacterium sp.]|uniref:T9SS type B sorting domain-containing protein n=1 Tax=uncultured Flavobacterium sp. TaxID=165435 RepID=UPI0030CA2B4E
MFKLLRYLLLFSSSMLCSQNLPNDCVNYIQVCDNLSISYDVSGAGTQEIVPPSCASVESNSLWLRVTIEQAGTLGFTLIPNSSNIVEDYDFWIFGPNSDCTNLGTPIRCSTTNPQASGQTNNHTGLNASSTDTQEGPGPSGDSFVKELSTLVGESYFIVIDRPMGSSPFTLSWSGTAIISNPFSTQNFNDFNDVVLCDQAADNSEPFDFSTLTTPYLGSIMGYTLSYFENDQDASFNINELLGVTSISQGIYYARINNTSSSCYITKPIQVVFNSVQPLVLRACDDTDDGVYAFDTSTLEADLLNGLTGFNLSFTDENNNALPSPMPNPFITTAQTINVMLVSNTGNFCTFTTTIDFIINNKPQFFSVPASLTTLCNQNDPQQQLEFASFDTSTFQATILGGQTNMIVEYYDENNDALSPLPNPFTTSTQNVTVKIKRANDFNCFSTAIIPFKVLSKPDIVLQAEPEFVCTNSPSYYVTLNAGLVDINQINNHTYQWFLNENQIIGAISYSLQVNTAGNYSVSVTNSDGCEQTRTNVVIESNSAAIENIEIFDLSDNNTISIIVSGIGNYVYSLDNVTFQESNIFLNVIAGFYTVYVKDLYNCETSIRSINVLGLPKFFSPNGDGYNDFWNITNVDSELNSEIVIRIFDRYGKLLSQINPIGSGWNGYFNGYKLPADDYWYTVELQNGKIVKGHFALVR